MNLNRRAVGLDQSPMIERVADLLDQRLKSDEVQHDTSAVQFTFHCDRHLIVMPMQGLSAAVGKNEKVSGCEVKIVFGNLDAKTAWHEPEGTQKPEFFQGGRGVSRDSGSR